MTELDEAITALRQERDDCRAEVDRIEYRIGEINAEIRGMERARELFGPQVADERAPHRISAQKPIMALFGPEKGTWTEAGIVERTGLPTESVHRFLLRAVQKGWLQRWAAPTPELGVEYGLPVIPGQDALETTGPRQLFRQER